MTTAAVLTPPGRGAIAVVAVEGTDALRAVGACFVAANRKPLGEQPLGAIRYGRWRVERGEELIVVCRGEESIEIHCHGGAAASAAILRALEEQGVAIADGENPDQARSGLAPRARFARQAWRDLQHAPTERVAVVLLDQAHGALDDAAEEVDVAVQAGDTQGAIAKLDALLAWRRLGERLLEPTRVVLAGPPNAGKSSLINALVGYERAIVYDQPGTTRDVVTATTAVRGWPIRLADTAGLRESDDPIEAAGVALARKTLAEADVVVTVHEASDFNAADADGFRRSVVGKTSGARSIAVASKADLVPKTTAGAIATSTVTGVGIAELLDALADTIAPAAPTPGEAVPFHREHFAGLSAARDAVAGGDSAAAREALDAVSLD